MAGEEKFRLYRCLDETKLLLKLFVAAVLVTVGVSSTSGASTNAGRTSKSVTAPLTGFGGYRIGIEVSQISAQWTVPAIAAKSPEGVAATWVGAQNAADTNFIQLGILEIANEVGGSSYEAFWSDVAAQFAPQYLGRVEEGDKISVSMTRDAKGWLLKFNDHNESLVVNKQINYSAAGRFDWAEWLQEDPSPSHIAYKDVAYPDVANVKFQKLLVNGHVPKLVEADGITLSATGGALRVPTPMKNDAFSFVRPKGPADQYLVDAAVLDTATAKLNAEFAQWATLSRASKSSDVKAIEMVFTFTAKQFESQVWPRDAQGGIDNLVRFIAKDVSNLKSWAAGGFKMGGPAFNKIEVTAQQENRAVVKLRALLGLPPP
jgi:hypothetical protein